jgi:hypothetical protein
MTQLRSVGRLSAETSLPSYRWTTDDDIVVAVDGTRVEVAWDAAPDASADSWAQMERPVESALLVECLERRVPVSIEWTERQELSPSGSTVVWAFTGDAWLARRSPVPLDQHADTAALTSRCQPISEALKDYRVALSQWEGDLKSSHSRLYLALETLVIAKEGGSGESNWVQTGHAIGFDQERTLSLMLSLHYGRHQGMAGALHQLKRLGLAPLDPNGCLTEAEAFITAYIGSVRSGRVTCT